MVLQQKIQFIMANGQPEWAVLPYEDYRRLRDNEDALIQLLAQQHTRPKHMLPKVFQDRLMQGESPIRIWREFKQMTQFDLANKAGISVPYLSQLEHQIRSGSKKVLKNISRALELDLDTLI